MIFSIIHLNSKCFKPFNRQHNRIRQCRESSTVYAQGRPPGRPPGRRPGRPPKGAPKGPLTQKQIEKEMQRIEREYEQYEEEYNERERKAAEEEREDSAQWRQNWKEFFAHRKFPKDEQELRKYLKKIDPSNQGTIAGNFTPDVLYKYPSHEEEDYQASFIFSELIQAPREIIYPYISQWDKLPSLFDIIGAVFHEEDEPELAIVIVYYEYPEHPMLQIMFPIFFTDIIENKMVRAESFPGFCPLNIEIRLEVLTPFETELIVSVTHAAPMPYYNSPGLTFVSLYLRQIMLESVQIFKKKIEGKITKEELDDLYAEMRPEHTEEELEVVKKVPWRQFTKFNNTFWQGMTEAMKMEQKEQSGEFLSEEEVKESAANTFAKFIKEQKNLPDDDEGYVDELMEGVKEEVELYFDQNEQKIKEMMPFMNENVIYDLKYEGANMDQSFQKLYEDMANYMCEKYNIKEEDLDQLDENKEEYELVLNKVLKQQQLTKKEIEEAEEIFNSAKTSASSI